MAQYIQLYPEEVLGAIKESVTYARKFTDDVEWSCEDGTRTDMDYISNTFFNCNKMWC